MNPPTNPFLHPSFSFHPPHPNPDPNFSFVSFPNAPVPHLLPPNPHQSPNPNPNFSYPPFPPPAPAPAPAPAPPFLLPPDPTPNPNLSSPSLPFSDSKDVKTTISTLKHFVDLAETALKSASDFLHLPQTYSPNADFCACPFDSRHRMPPESLFRHFLSCSSLPSPIDLAILDLLHYPNSLRAHREKRFVRSLLKSDADLCLSLDEHGGFGGSSFFYKDCPGVVSTSDQDSSKRTFTLPAVLSVECANFICDKREGEMEDLSDGILKLRILPSELWVLRSEIEVWRDFPLSYSYTVLRVASCLFRLKESEILKWVISNSPWYGIVIDVPMRDHIFLILKLCLKAIWREACQSLELLLGREVSDRDGFLNLKALNFECVRLREVLEWLALQLSVLYGDVNGKSIAIDMLKQCLLSAGMGSLLLPLGQKRREDDASREDREDLDVAVDSKGVGPVESMARGSGVLIEIAEDKPLLCGQRNLFGGTSFENDEVFVSQVAAAIAALHERALLEKRIKELRFGRPHSKYLLINEHANLSIRAMEERGKRSDYRPILEHDGLLWQRANNLDRSKSKTREELLAEERDYKRRRISYRGKKVKRSTTQVMRDIIEEHMEEIKLAGGIGCFIKGATDTGDMTTDDDLLRSGCNSFETSRNLHKYGKQLDSDYNAKSTRSEDAYTEDQLKRSCGLNSSLYHPIKECHLSHDAREVCKRSVAVDDEDRKYRSRSPLSYRSHRDKDNAEMTRNKYDCGGGEHQSSGSPHRRRSLGLSHERYRHRREQDNAKMTRNKYDRGDSFSSNWSKVHDDRHYSSSNLSDDGNASKYDGFYKSDRGYGGRVDGNGKSDIVTQNLFEDRYDPSDCNRNESKYDDDSSSSRYVRPDKLQSPDDTKNFKELRRLEHSSKGRRDNYQKM